MGEVSFVDRAVLAIVKNRHLDRLSMKALMKANELLALGTRLASMRDSDEPLQAVFAEGQTNRFLARAYEEVSAILASRWDKILDRNRPQYTSEQRYRILRLKKLLSWSREETADKFRLSVTTIARWETEGEGGENLSDLSLVRPQPPVRRYADVVRQLVHTIRLSGFGGYERIAQTLARAGFRISKRTVGRILREKPPRGNPVTSLPQGDSRVLRARFPNHIFLVGLPEIPSLFGLFRFKLAVVLDVFSRMPLGARLFDGEPHSEDLAQLLRDTIKRHGPSRHLVSDQGSQFTSKLFRKTLEALGILQRFDAIGKVGSIAILERFWRTLKSLLMLDAFRPLVKKELKRRLELELRYYAFYRPHQGLGGATPAEIYFGRKPAHLDAVPPPRGRPGEGPSKPPFVIEYLDPEGRLPVLVKAA